MHDVIPLVSQQANTYIQFLGSRFVSTFRLEVSFVTVKYVRYSWTCYGEVPATGVVPYATQGTNPRWFFNCGWVSDAFETLPITSSIHPKQAGIAFVYLVRATASSLVKLD